MTVYLDLFFLVNLASDFLIFLSALRIKGAKIRWIRVFLAALSGGVFASLALFFPILQGFFSSLIIFFLMTFILFGFGGIKSFFQNALCLFLCFFINGGIYYSLVLATGRDNFFIFSVSLLSGTAIIFLLSKKIRQGKAKSYGDVLVYYKGKKIFLRGLIDNGNMAIDSLSGLPVIICEDVVNIKLGRDEFIKTATGMGKIRVFIPDLVKIKYEGFIYEGNNVAIGITEDKLSSDNSFNALIGGILLDGLNKKNKRAFGKAIKRRGFLHRGGTSPSATP